MLLEMFLYRVGCYSPRPFIFLGLNYFNFNHKIKLFKKHDNSNHDESCNFTLEQLRLCPYFVIKL
jgi:hypothetical protein